MNQSVSPRPTQVSCWGWICCKQRIMIRYLVKSSPIRSFWFTDRWRIEQSQSSQEPSLTDQTQGRQSRVLVWGGPSLSQGLVNEKVLCQSRVHIPGELSQPPAQSPGLVCGEPSPAWVQDLVWEKLNQSRMKQQWSRKNQGLSKVQV